MSGSILDIANSLGYLIGYDLIMFIWFHMLHAVELIRGFLCFLSSRNSSLCVFASYVIVNMMIMMQFWCGQNFKAGNLCCVLQVGEIEVS